MKGAFFKEVKDMRKIFLVIMAVLLMASNLYAAGSCTQTLSVTSNPIMKTIKFVCTGDAADGSIPNTAISATNFAEIDGYYLYMVSAYPTSGGTAPDAADVTILHGAYDVLGGKGVSLIHATLQYDVIPYSTFMGLYRYWPVTEILTLAVANQSTNSANFTIELIFAR